MLLQREVLDNVTLAEFDEVNFEESHRMDYDEWAQMLSCGINIIYTARTEQNEIAAILVLKTASEDVGIWYFYSVAVAEKFRKCGLGTRLFKQAIAETISGGLINSHCHVDNIASIGFHKSLGFKAVQYVPDFYGDFEDAVLWERAR
jgi:ribosomal protein S18 acetylase RimI-like enzyme